MTYEEKLQTRREQYRALVSAFVRAQRGSLPSEARQQIEPQLREVGNTLGLDYDELVQKTEAEMEAEAQSAETDEDAEWVPGQNVRLRGAEAPTLTEEERRRINGRAAEIAQRPLSTLTSEDLRALSRYTGLGGLDAESATDAAKGLDRQRWSIVRPIYPEENAEDFQLLSEVKEEELESGRSETSEEEGFTPDLEESVQKTVYDVPIEDTYTDPDRFQPREEAYAEESARKVAENENPELMEPIDLWPDPEEDGRLYVLAGHGRREGYKRRGEETIPAEIHDDWTEEQAIEYAYTENQKGTELTLPEKANYLRMLRREAGESKTALLEEARDRYGRDGRRILALSYLSPDGRAIDTLQRLAGSSATDRSDAETMAIWTGKVMMQWRNTLSREGAVNHEREVYEHIRDNYKTEGEKYTSFREVKEYIQEAIQRVQMEEGGEIPQDKSLNLESVRPQTQQEREIDQKLEEARDQLREDRKRLDEAREKFAKRRREDENVTREDVRRALADLEEEVTASQQKVIELERQAEKGKQAVAQSQKGLFGGRENPKSSFDREWVRIGTASKLKTTEQTFTPRGVLFMSADMDLLVIVPQKDVRAAEGAVESQKAQEAFQTWFGYAPENEAVEFRIKDVSPEPVGAALLIHYTSRKVMQEGDTGEPHRYYHYFQKGLQEAYQMGGALIIGRDPTCHVCESDLEINRRGILN